MARNQAIGRNTSLRQLKRINNKSRLKIVLGDFESAETLLLEEGKLSWGVDTEDANEHHLQEVLVASQRAQSPQRSTRSADKPAETPAAYIPTPDSTGVVNNYNELYPSDRWTDPAGYIRSSDTGDIYLDNALANDFTYYMDERDQEWLEKNNQEATGEGTSAQGALSTGSTRSARSAKSKGKEPETNQPIAITEDEFELAMGIFEKVTHEKTEFLHHSLETGMTFPAFTEYQDTFSKPLSHTHFAALVVPEWIPESTKLLRIAKTIYPHWKERRIDRGGRRIMPMLNFDESDTLNESYVCFRRRDVKAVRKTRASQVTPFDKFYRLSTELAVAIDIAQAAESREPLKKECLQQDRDLFEKRLAFVDCKRKISPPGDKNDDDLIFDKERTRKKLPKTKIRPGESPAPSMVPQEPFPQERFAKIQAAMEADLAQQKARDTHWEDQIDNGYQLAPLPFASRLFKYFPARAPSSVTDSEGEEVLPHAIRLRRGRGGRMIIDRRINPRSSRGVPLAAISEDDDERRRLERWRFDTDDGPGYDPEADRLLVDDFESKYLQRRATLLDDKDISLLMTDPTLSLIGPDGRPEHVLPFRIGAAQHQHQNPRRDAALPRAVSKPNSNTITAPPPTPPNPVPPNPGSSPTQASPIKKVIPPSAVPQMRISSNGGMRQSVPNGSSISAHVQSAQPVAQQVNIGTRPSISVPHLEVKQENGTPSVNTNTALFNTMMQVHGHNTEGEPGVQTKQEVPSNYVFNGFQGYPMDMATLKRYQAALMSNQANGAMHYPASNISVKIPASGRVQWPSPTQPRVEGTPTRVPSTNGMRAIRTPMTVSQALQNGNVVHSSPPRIPATPAMSPPVSQQNSS